MPGIIQDVNDFEKTSTVLYFNGQKKEILNTSKLGHKHKKSKKKFWKWFWSSMDKFGGSFSIYYLQLARTKL